MGYPIKTTYPTITVAQGQSVSAALDLDTATAVGFVVPAALEATTAQISFLAATSLTGTYKVVKQGGTKLALPIAASDFGLLVGLSDLAGIRFLKIVCETAGGVAVAQATADRVFEVVKAQLV